MHSYVTHDSLDPPESTSKTASRSVQPFLHSSGPKVPILYNGPLLPLKIDIWTPIYNTWLLGPTRIHNSNGILIGSVVLAGLMMVTDRPRYCGCNNRPHLSLHTAVRPNKQTKLESGPMPNLMVALPNVAGALCSTPQSLADAHY